MEVCPSQMSAWKVVGRSSKHLALQGEGKAFASLSDIFMGSVGSQNSVARVQVMAFPTPLLWGNSCDPSSPHCRRPFCTQKRGASLALPSPSFLRLLQGTGMHSALPSAKPVSHGPPGGSRCCWGAGDHCRHGGTKR